MDNRPTTKNIKINIDPILDKEGLNSIREQAKKTASEFSRIFKMKDKDGEEISTVFSDAMEKAFGNAKSKLEEVNAKYSGLLERRERIQKLLPYAEGEDRKTLKIAERALNKELKQNEIFQKERNEVVKDSLSEIGSKALDLISKIGNNIKDSLDEIASYNVSGSIFGTSEARQTMLKYGTNEAQTYGLTKTMGRLNLNSEEDLWYMNPNQREKFAELIGRYTSKYEELANKGFFKSYEEFKLEFELFKEDLYYDLISVVIDNKDTIMQFLRLGVEAMKGVINFLGKVNGIGGGSRNVGDIINSYSNQNSNTSQTYSFTNNFNMNDVSAQSAQMFSANIMNTIKQLTQS